MNTNESRELVAPDPVQVRAITESPPRGARPLERVDRWALAGAVVKAKANPKGLDTAAAVFVAMHYGGEFGIAEMASMNCVMVVNNRPSLYGDAPLSLCMRSLVFDHAAFHEEWSGTPDTDDWGCTCTVARIGANPVSRTYTVGDAKRAKLWKKPGAWTTDPGRMLQLRSRSRLLRDVFADVLGPCRIAEEYMGVDERNVPEPGRGKLDRLTQAPTAPALPEPAAQIADAPATPMSDTPDTPDTPDTSALIVDAAPPADPADDATDELPMAPSLFPDEPPKKLVTPQDEQVEKAQRLIEKLPNDTVSKILTQHELSYDEIPMISMMQLLKLVKALQEAPAK